MLTPFATLHLPSLPPLRYKEIFNVTHPHIITVNSNLWDVGRVCGLHQEEEYKVNGARSLWGLLVLQQGDRMGLHQ